MKINWVEYKNAITGLEIKRLFLNDLTLLVGLTGVGKTNVLNAICMFASIARRKYNKEMLNTNLKIEFEVEECKYEWYIKFGNEISSAEESKDENNTLKSRATTSANVDVCILDEYLLVDGNTYFERKGETIYYKSEKISGLSQIISCINIFGNDEIARKISEAFQKISMYHMQFRGPEERGNLALKNVDLISESESDVNRMLYGNYFPLVKLCLLFKKRRNVFTEIEKTYCDIFKNVEGLYFEADENINTYVLFQKEKAVPTPISYEHLSSGMYKTLTLLTDLYSCSSGSVFLIDEFENSFGVNCINEVIDIVNSNSKKFQFIITSHHPYIINNVSIDYWSIVDRKGSLITAHSAKEFGIGTTKHDAFFQLINIWDYEENPI